MSDKTAPKCITAVDIDIPVCFACEKNLSEHEPTLLTPIRRDDQGRPMAWATLCLQCAQKLIAEGEIDPATLQSVTIHNSHAVTVLPIVGELRGNQPITTGLCVVCRKPAAWIDSQLVTTPNEVQLWIHKACKLTGPNGQK